MSDRQRILDAFGVTEGPVICCRRVQAGNILGADCPDCGHNNLLHSNSQPCIGCTLLGHGGASAPETRRAAWAADAADAMLDFMRSVTEQDIESIHGQERAHLQNGRQRASQMLLWPVDRIPFDQRSRYASGASFRGLRLVLAQVDRPTVVVA